MLAFCIPTIFIFLAHLPSPCQKKNVGKDNTINIMRLQAINHLENGNFTTLTQLKKEGNLYWLEIANKYWQTSIKLKENMAFAYVLVRQDIQQYKSDEKYSYKSYIGATTYDKVKKTYAFVLCESNKAPYVQGNQSKLHVNQRNFKWKCPPKTKSCKISQYYK